MEYSICNPATLSLPQSILLKAVEAELRSLTAIAASTTDVDRSEDLKEHIEAMEDLKVQLLRGGDTVGVHLSLVEGAPELAPMTGMFS